MIIQKSRGLNVWQLEKILNVVSDFRLHEDHEREDGMLGEKGGECHTCASGDEYSYKELKNLENEIQTAIDNAWDDMKKERQIDYSDFGHYEVTYYDGNGNKFEFKCTSDKDLKSIPNIVR